MSLITADLGKKRFLSRLLDEQTFSDPWGVGWRATVRRHDHPEWEAWRKANLGESRMKRLGEDAALAIALEDGEKQRPRKGFRTAPRRTRRAAAAQAGEVDSARVIAKIRELAGDEGIISADADDLATLKEGLIAVGVARFARVIDGEEMEATEDDLRELLFDFRDDDGGTVRYLQATIDGEDGEEIEVPYGGQPFQDAVAEWLLDCAENAEAYTAGWSEAAEDFLPGTSDGSTDTGSGEA